MNNNLDNKLGRYAKILKGISKPVNYISKASMAFTGGFLMSIPVSEGAIISGTANQSINKGGTFGLVIDGGIDIKFRIIGSGTSNQENIQVSGPGVQGFKGTTGGGINYPFAMSVGQAVSGTVKEVAGYSNSLANEKYTGGNWLALPDGEVRYLGFKLDSGNYGWVRVQKNNSASITVLDWAYEDTGNPITIVLPVELISFEGTVQESFVGLDWTTASEDQNAGFEVQRSIDGVDFETQGFVEGNGTSFNLQNYYFEDRDVRKGQKYYYRLKQIDYDGGFEYSNIISVELEGSKTTISNFYPNPTEGITNIEYTANTNAELVITIFSTTGQELLRETRQVSEGFNNLNFNFSALGKGNYFIKLQTDDDINYEKLIIR